MNKVTRGERLLQKLVDQDKMTEKGRDWLIAALDPMHDTQLKNLAGWPDLSDQPSVVRCVKKSLTIGKSPSLPAGNWSLVIQSLPVLNETVVSPRDYWKNVDIGSSTLSSSPSGPEDLGDMIIGGVHYAQFETASESWVSSGSSTVGAGSVSLPNDFASGNGRLIGMGFEVNNTTADIYKQGTVHVFRQPQQSTSYVNYNAVEELTVRNAAGDGTRSFPTYRAYTGRQVLDWPDNEEACTLLSGTRTWKAEDGCYVVVPFESEENPITPAEYVTPLLTRKFQASMLNDTEITTMQVGKPARTSLSPPTQPPGGIIAYDAVKAHKWAPVHSAGTAFVGLSDQTTLTLTVNMYYEYFPNSDDPSLCTLAKPSAEFDPVALALYSKALGDLPVGVPASMNGLGDWFAGVVSEFAPAIGAALMPILGPFSGAVGLAAKGIADSYLTSQSPQTKPTTLSITRPPPALPPRDQKYAVGAVSVARQQVKQRKAQRRKNKKKLAMAQARGLALR